VATMMLEIEDALKPMFEPLRELLAETRAQVERGHALGREVLYESFEGRLTDKLAAVERGAHAATLSALAVDAPQILINGALHVRVVRDHTTYRSQAGEVSVEHSLYRRAGVIDGVWLPGAARDMAYLLSQGTSREAQATAQEMGRLPYSRSSFERVGHAVGEAYVAQHQHVEQIVIEEYQVPREVSSISASLDRVSLPMEEPRPRPRGRPRKGAPKKPIERVYRMAYCGTVTLHDAEGKAIHTIRYGTMPEGDAAALCEGLASDVLAIRRKRRGLPITLLSDGAPEMCNRLDEAFDADAFDSADVHRLIDFWHAVEKLSAAASVIAGKDAAPALIARWKLLLLNRADARRQILDELVASEREHVRVGDERPVHDAITYLTNNAERMNYAAARSRKLPIGSGNVEATCKSLVGVRMKRPGSRWKTDTGEHVLHLRALALSDRWTQAMDITLRPTHTRIRVAA
jgi:hypothetical protein